MVMRGRESERRTNHVHDHAAPELELPIHFKGLSVEREHETSSIVNEPLDGRSGIVHQNIGQSRVSPTFGHTIDILVMVSNESRK